jgi:2-polyprenyl-3-methyl-5-hydroxy-6-metoxy-1,4-benzoquinol methylase
MARFYQHTYEQAGLTTDLPDAAALNGLIATGFRASEKDFSGVIELLETLSVPAGSRVLDFGANWGYGVWQLRQAGFAAIGYEPAEQRAAFSAKLGVEVFTDWFEIQSRAPFDVMFSSHVLEHTPDPARALHRQLEILSPNGWLIGCFPNGSEVFRKANPTAFHHLWGQVHPVMLEENFVRGVLPGSSLAIGAFCPEDLEALKGWNRTAPWTGTLSAGEMLFVWTHPKTNSEHRADF